jgi:hypothetical protein
MGQPYLARDSPRACTAASVTESFLAPSTVGQVSEGVDYGLTTYPRGRLSPSHPTH